MNGVARGAWRVMHIKSVDRVDGGWSRRLRGSEVGMKMVVGGVNGVDMIGGVKMIDGRCEYDGRRSEWGREGGMEGHAHREGRSGR